MVFTTTNLFKSIPCPYAEQCRLTHCIYAHDSKPPSQPAQGQPVESSSADVNPQSQGTERSHEPPSKRRRVTYDSLANKPPSRAEQIRKALAATRSVSSPTHQNGGALPPPPPIKQATPGTSGLRYSPSLTKPASPPPTHGKTTSLALSVGANNSNAPSNGATPPRASRPGVKETLNPRMIANPPESHAKRSLYLKHLHGEMVRLNAQLAEAASLAGASDALLLSQQEIITFALDEEESRARDQPQLYGNVIKQRIAFYKKMKQEVWIEHVKVRIIREPAKPPQKKAKVIDTGLTPDEETLILPHLVANQTPLAPFGYIPTPPTKEEAAQAAEAVEASKNFEICDRCSARFQVFPDRDAEGRLTSNGSCKYHPNRKVFPQKSKTDAYTGGKEPFYPCCGDTVGSAGCTVNEAHVFKSSSPARLAAVLPFVVTPENQRPAKDKQGREVKAVSFDCEMGYTVFGLELIRLTAVSWPEGEELVDVLVRPMGTIIDLNSRFSGVWPEHFTNAIPYQQWLDKPPSPSKDGKPSPLPLVDSPARARELLCTFLTPGTPLIGHAIDNDLNATRLCHPSIIDTVILFPHHRGLPLRFGLKMLSMKYLDRDIQTGGERGHDSKEDAVATGDLVRVKAGERWKSLKHSGWQIVQRKLVPPREEQEVKGQGGEVQEMMEKALGGQKRARKKGEISMEEEGNGLAAVLKRSGVPEVAAEDLVELRS